MNIRQLFECHYPSLVWFLYGRLGDRDLAEGLAQVAFVPLIDKPPCAPDAWLYVVAGNIARDAPIRRPAPTRRCAASRSRQWCTRHSPCCRSATPRFSSCTPMISPIANRRGYRSFAHISWSAARTCAAALHPRAWTSRAHAAMRCVPRPRRGDKGDRVPREFLAAPQHATGRQRIGVGAARDSKRRPRRVHRARARALDIGRGARARLGSAHRDDGARHAARPVRRRRVRARA
ncbi:MAG: hypothetical protein H0U66_13750 [Gemmatimonadaceae bacterium]|nr:hypothetical protein [Gemmatimonadaceae bacterium]